MGHIPSPEAILLRYSRILYSKQNAELFYSSLDLIQEARFWPSKDMHSPKTWSLCLILQEGTVSVRLGATLRWNENHGRFKYLKAALSLLWSRRDEACEGLVLLLLIVLMMEQVIGQTVQVASSAGEGEEMDSLLPLSCTPRKKWILFSWKECLLVLGQWHQ